MKRKYFICLLLVLTLVMGSTQTINVSAKVKYTKTEKKLAYTLAEFQDNELIDPDSFKIKHIYKTNYVLKKSQYDFYKAIGLYKQVKTLTWKVEYTAKNCLGGTVKDEVYLSSTWNYFDMDTDDLEEQYNDKTDYTKYRKSKKFVKEQ